MDNEAWRNALAANMARLRRSHGLTQAELGEKLSYSDKSISKWERAEGVPDIAVLMRLCDMYNVTLDALTGRNEANGERTEAPLTGISRALTLLIAESGIWLTAIIAFSVLTFANTGIQKLWLAFIYALPFSFILPGIYLIKWRLYPWAVLSFSLALWAACVCLQLSVNTNMAGMIYIAGCAIQLTSLIALGAIARRKARR